MYTLHLVFAVAFCVIKGDLENSVEEIQNNIDEADNVWIATKEPVLSENAVSGANSSLNGPDMYEIKMDRRLRPLRIPIVKPAAFPIIQAKEKLLHLHNNTGNKIQSAQLLRKREGSHCRRSFDGQSGYCILAHRCLHVLKAYRVQGVKVDICTYIQNMPVVCCPLVNKHFELESITARKCKQHHRSLKQIKIDGPLQASAKQCVSSVPMIVGGEPTNWGEFSHMAALGWPERDGKRRWSCGGTLINEYFVLTAAHCATSAEQPPDMVRLGVQDLNASSSIQQDISILVIILHPLYHSATYYHDIALVKLAKRAVISPLVRPGCLWQLPDVNIKTVIATGWGRTQFLGPKSNRLRKVILNLIEQNLCRELYKKERRLPDGIIDEQFCAGDLVGRRDTCQGDSGGPLHVQVPEYNCVKFIIGITSFGKFCAAPNAPGVYTKISSYLDWIEKIAFTVDVN